MVFFTEFTVLQAGERSSRWAGLTQWLQLHSCLIQSFKSLDISARVHAPASLFKMIQVLLMEIWWIIQPANWHGIPGSACNNVLSVIAVSSGSSPKPDLFPLCRRLQPRSRHQIPGMHSSRNAQHCFWKGFTCWHLQAPEDDWFEWSLQSCPGPLCAQEEGQAAPPHCPALGLWSWPGTFPESSPTTLFD